MDDEYVSIFLWNNDVAMLPETSAQPPLVTGLVPIVGRVVKGIITSAFNPRLLLKLAFEDRFHLEDDILSSSSSCRKREPSTMAPVVVLSSQYL